MMRPVSVAMPPFAPDGLAFTITGNGNNRHVVLTWNDNSISETSFLVQSTTDNITWIDGGTVQSPLNQPNTHQPRTFTDPARYNANTVYLYRVVAQNTIGYGGAFMNLTAQSVSPSVVVGSAPTITVVAPNGGESWAAGSTQTITWTYTGNPGSAVKIELLNAGSPSITYYAVVGSGGNGSYNLIIPANQVAGINYPDKDNQHDECSIYGYERC